VAQFPSREGRIFCSLFVVIGIVVACIGAWELMKSLRTEHWPVAEGIVQSAEIIADPGGDTCSAEVTYDYRVNGVSCRGDKIAVGEMSSSAAYAQGILNGYPVGKKVTVHYAPGKPSEAVLETGIHGGTWICLGVGAAFILLGSMFLQVQRAAARAQAPGAPESSSVKVWPDGSVSMDKPPVLMGVIFLLAGIGLCFVPPDPGNPNWLMYAGGAVLGCGGIMALLMRLEDKTYGTIAGLVFLVPLLITFHWVSFGSSERTGMATALFALFTIVLDLAIVAGLIHWLVKRLRT
jgi:hypothetical protein